MEREGEGKGGDNVTIEIIEMYKTKSSQIEIIHTSREDQLKIKKVEKESKKK